MAEQNTLVKGSEYTLKIADGELLLEMRGSAMPLDSPIGKDNQSCKYVGQINDEILGATHGFVYDTANNNHMLFLTKHFIFDNNRTILYSPRTPSSWRFISQSEIEKLVKGRQIDNG